jgi:hypothetical protein
VGLQGLLPESRPTTVRPAEDVLKMCYVCARRARPWMPPCPRVPRPGLRPGAHDIVQRPRRAHGKLLRHNTAKTFVSLCGLFRHKAQRRTVPKKGSSCEREAATAPAIDWLDVALGLSGYAAPSGYKRARASTRVSR